MPLSGITQKSDHTEQIMRELKMMEDTLIPVWKEK